MVKLSRIALAVALSISLGCGDDDKGGGGTGGGAAGTGGGAGGMGGMGAAFAGCTTFEDQTDAAAMRRVSVGAGNTYTPKCMRVKVGQTVTIAASATHPLRPGPQAGNPIQQASSDAMTTFTGAGVFGFFCQNHGSSTGMGMAGAIEVVP